VLDAQRRPADHRDARRWCWGCEASGHAGTARRPGRRPGKRGHRRRRCVRRCRTSWRGRRRAPRLRAACPGSAGRAANGPRSPRLPRPGCPSARSRLRLPTAPSTRGRWRRDHVHPRAGLRQRQRGRRLAGHLAALGRRPRPHLFVIALPSCSRVYTS
jgi:hypothetical protein